MPPKWPFWPKITLFDPQLWIFCSMFLKFYKIVQYFLWNRNWVSIAFQKFWSDSPGAVFRVKPGWDVNVGLRKFSEENFLKIFALKIIFMYCKPLFSEFLLFWFILGVGVRLSRFHEKNVFGPPIYRRGTIVFSGVRPCVFPDKCAITVHQFWNFVASCIFISSCAL